MAQKRKTRSFDEKLFWKATTWKTK